MSVNGTPLKWAGSKARIMDTLREHLPAGQRLVEPFAGSCSVMLNTDYPAYLVADINPDLINLYQVICEDTRDFLDTARLLFSTANTAEDYYHLRQSFNRDKSNRTQSAAMFLYLNRHGYNGLCRYNKQGIFNVPYGKYTSPYFPEQEIHFFAEKAKRATFLCCDFEETLALVCPDDVVYCDPPYYPASDTANFTQYHTQGFDKFDQYRLVTAAGKAARDGAQVVVSNSHIAHDVGLYAGFEVNHISAPRAISGNGNRGRVGEIIVTMGR